MAKVQAKLDEMQAQFDAAMAQKQALEDDAAATQKKMDSATALINALAGGCILTFRGWVVFVGEITYPSTASPQRTASCMKSRFAPLRSALWYRGLQPWKEARFCHGQHYPGLIRTITTATTGTIPTLTSCAGNLQV